MIINKQQIDYTKQPMFFGEALNIQRYDTFKYEYFFKNYQRQLEFFWVPTEIDLTKDRSDFKNLSKHEAFIFTENLKYQMLLDSVQSRGIPYLLKYVSLPELESAMKQWESMETLHSYSYSHIIRNVFPNPKVFIDSIMNSEAILERVNETTKYYEKIIDNDTNDIKQKLYLTMVSINILESIRFYVSFACAFVMAENKKMEGNAKIIKLIQRDEALHTALTQQILKYMHNSIEEGFTQIAMDLRSEVTDMFREAAISEIKWAKYLFQHGSVIGLNAEILEQYIMWLTNKRAGLIGIDKIFVNAPKENPLGWIQNWTSENTVAIAPQESELESYKKGAIVSDLSNNLDLEEFL